MDGTVYVSWGWSDAGDGDQARLHAGGLEAGDARLSEVPTPWLCLQHDLRLADIDPAGIRRVTGRTMAENVAAPKAGTVDVIQVFGPFPSLPLAGRAAHVWYEAARHARLATRRAPAPGAGDRSHREVGGEGQRRRDRRHDRGLLHRCATHDPRCGLQAVQGAWEVIALGLPPLS